MPLWVLPPRPPEPPHHVSLPCEQAPSMVVPTEVFWSLANTDRSTRMRLGDNDTRPTVNPMFSTPMKKAIFLAIMGRAMEGPMVLLCFPTHTNKSIKIIPLVAKIRMPSVQDPFSFPPMAESLFRPKKRRKHPKSRPTPRPCPITVNRVQKNTNKPCRVLPLWALQRKCKRKKRCATINVCPSVLLGMILGMK